MLAKTLARGGKVVGICTENNRMADYQDTSLYPGLNPYEMFKDGFEPPYSSARYTEAIMAAEDSGAAVIVLDSGSDEWEGPGGVLDLHEADPAAVDPGRRRQARQNEFPGLGGRQAASQEVRQRNHAAQSAPLIICFRAQPKTAMPLVDGKRKVVIWGSSRFAAARSPTSCDGTYYWTWIVRATMRYSRSYEHERHVFPPGRRIDADTGSRLLAMIAPTDKGSAISADQVLDIETMISEAGADRARFLAFMGVSAVAGIPQTDLQKAD